MMKNIVLLSVLVGCLLAGCSKEEVVTDFRGDFLELSKRYSDEIKTNKVMKISEMTADDIIVMVNGYPLTKRTFDDLMVIRAKRLMRRKNANPAAVEGQLEQFKREYIPLFVNQRLLLDKARELKVLTAEDVEKEVNDDFAKMTKGNKKTAEKLVKAFPGDFKYYLYDVAAQKWMEALVEKHIPPKIVVDDAFISNCQAQVALDNAEMAKTNELIRANLLTLKKSVESGKVTFDRAAQVFSQDQSSDTNSPSFWGEFERGEFEDKGLQAAVFALPVGKISDPIEDEDGYHLVKVLKVKPLEKNKDGRILRNEVRRLAHIFVEKIPLLVRQDDEAMYEDIKRQMQLQAIDDYVGNLRTNSAYKVIYPHGDKLF